MLEIETLASKPFYCKIYRTKVRICRIDGCARFPCFREENKTQNEGGEHERRKNST